MRAALEESAYAFFGGMLVMISISLISMVVELARRLL